MEELEEVVCLAAHPQARGATRMCIMMHRQAEKEVLWTVWYLLLLSFELAASLHISARCDKNQVLFLLDDVIFFLRSHCLGSDFHGSLMCEKLN